MEGCPINSGTDVCDRGLISSLTVKYCVSGKDDASRSMILCENNGIIQNI